MACLACGKRLHYDLTKMGVGKPLGAAGEALVDELLLKVLQVTRNAASSLGSRARTPPRPAVVRAYRATMAKQPKLRQASLQSRG